MRDWGTVYVCVCVPQKERKRDRENGRDRDTYNLFTTLVYYRSLIFWGQLFSKLVCPCANILSFQQVAWLYKHRENLPLSVLALLPPSLCLTTAFNNNRMSTLRTELKEAYPHIDMLSPSLFLFLSFFSPFPLSNFSITSEMVDHSYQVRVTKTKQFSLSTKTAVLGWSVFGSFMGWGQKQKRKGGWFVFLQIFTVSNLFSSH